MYGTYGLADRLAASVGAPLDCSEFQGARAGPRESWVTLQDEVVAAAHDAPHRIRDELARALLRAVLEQPIFGQASLLSESAFRLLIEAIPTELEAALNPRSSPQRFGGRRYLLQHVWALPGFQGAIWLGHLAHVDPLGTDFLIQDMHVGKVPLWRDEDWPDRIDVLANLPAEPRPEPLVVLSILKAPRTATRALVRLAISHGADECDRLVRWVAGELRRHRTGAPDEDVDLFDWQIGSLRLELFRCLLELSGDPGQRGPLVEAARRGRLVSDQYAELLSAPIDRGTWAKGEAAWEIDAVVRAGDVRLLDGRLAGGDPWWCAGEEPLPWMIEVPAGSYAVDVVTASNPLTEGACAALHLHIDAATEVQRWSLVPTENGEDPEGYIVETGTASLGSVAAYNSGRVFETLPPSAQRAASVRWRELDMGPDGSLVLCTVGPQHQVCRTWLGHSHDGRPVALITDLGLLDLDLEVNPILPW